MSKIIDFYLYNQPNCDGETLEQIWQEGDMYFEVVHSYIQWLFPLIEPSMFNADAPLLTLEDIQIFRQSPELADRLDVSLNRFLAFMGLDDKFNRLEYFNEKAFIRPNHNWLRITRILKSLMILGLENRAKEFYNFLVQNNYGNANTTLYWADAVNEEILPSLPSFGN